MLFDAGNYGDGTRAERTIERFLWSRGIDTIDALIVSHADHDHFNGVFGLMDTFPIQTLYLSQPFLDFEQRSVVDLCESATGAGIPLRIVRRGDRLLVRDSSRSAPELRILHPPAGFRSQHDNANSIVLLVTYLGKRILITGDLERDGLTTLISEPIDSVDTLLAPHHGSRNSNPPGLYDWAGTGSVIVSTGERHALASLKTRAPQETQFFSTATSGAITVEISSSGTLRNEEYLKGRGDQ